MSKEERIDEIKVEEPRPAGFQLKITVEELRTRSIFLAVPMYGGQCSGMFAKSFGDLSALCHAYGIKLLAYFLFNESLITRARNYCCDTFMRSECTHLMFIDSDIGFNPNDVIALLAMQDPNPNGSTFRKEIPNVPVGIKPDLPNPLETNQFLEEVDGKWFLVTQNPPCPYDVIGAPYPKKCISWEKVVQAVNKGFADNNPNDLENFVGDYVFNPKSGKGAIPIGVPVEVAELGTGFMMIRKNTMEVFEKSYPQYHYKPDHVRTAEFDGSREIMQFFQAEIDLAKTHYVDVSTQYNAEPGTLFRMDLDKHASKRYLSEDYWFCYKLADIDIKTWLCPWMQLQHVGTYVFGGSLAHLAAAGASATADINLLKKSRK